LTTSKAYPIIDCASLSKEGFAISKIAESYNVRSLKDTKEREQASVKYQILDSSTAMIAYQRIMDSTQSLEIKFDRVQIKGQM
jgi:hypothetical protein